MLPLIWLCTGPLWPQIARQGEKLEELTLVVQMGITEKATLTQMSSSGLSVRSATLQLAVVVAAPVAALLGIAVWRLASAGRQTAAHGDEHAVAYSAASEPGALAEA